MGELPVSVARPKGAAGARVSQVSVQVLDRARVPAAWRDGVVLRVGSPVAGLAAGTVGVSVDYSAFRYAYGAEWGSRLRLWRLPECALSSPGVAGCSAVALPSVNDTRAGTVTAEVPVAPLEVGAKAAAGKWMLEQDASVGTLVALAAGPAGSGGDFSATPLSPSATWSSGGSSGEFTWSYPLRVPPGLGGPVPSITFEYSSSSVDGRSEATNNQPSWIGEGFDYWPGYIERRYVPCRDDMAGGANNTTKTGDLCWRSDNATMSLNGRATELVFEAGRGWHARSEDGSKIEKLTGASNGDNDGEYWKVTGPDGTQYFFGLNRPAGQSADTNSTWTVPVAGNHSGEPCHATGFTGSFCAQAWRWNLDYVIDPRGNTMSLWYDKEVNKYARNLTDSDDVSYVRGGTLTRIDYGTWDRGSGDRSVTPVAQVLFATADRCVTSSCGTHDATNWPDVPWDQECAASATSCPGRYSPTFWSTKRLSKVTTRVWDTTKPTPAWQEVDRWELTHSFPPAGDGSVHTGLWLDSITHTGLVGGEVKMPPGTFTPVSMPNRVLTKTNTTSNWQRIDYIVTETGAKIDVEYSLPECSAGNLPAAAHSNTKRCYPVITVDPADPYGEDLITEWWHKYVVTSVSESDLQLAGGHQAPPKFTYYEYVGAPAWHYTDDDGLVLANRKTWSQFRGYAQVKTRVGEDPGVQTLTVTSYLRGMHGDRLSPSGGTRTVTVPASIGSETVYDEDQFAGMVREQVVYNGTETKPVSKTVNVPWMSPPTASRTINGDTVTARFVNTATTYTGQALGVDGSRGWRVARTDSTFHGTYGTLEQTHEHGDVAVTGDEKCTSYVYNRNLTKNILQTVKRETTTALPCGSAPTEAGHMVSDVRYYYDEAGSVDTPPVYGQVSKTETLRDWTPGGGTSWQRASETRFDAFGRPSSTVDARGNTTTISYTPASGGPLTRTTSTLGTPFNWTTTTDVNPYWGSTVKITDPNGRVTDVEYDPLGRVWKVWQVGWSKAVNPTKPSVEYTYTLSPDRSAYPYVTTKTLHAGGGYLTSYQILDGLLRPRQTQSPAVGGGRIVTDTLYDKLGRVEFTYHAHAEPGNPSGTLWWEPQWSVPAVTQTIYDNANRPTVSIFLASDGQTNLVEKWRTTTRHEGDLTAVTPPQGGTPTTTVTDIHGRTVELRQHTTTAGVNGPYQATRYSYDSRDQLIKMTDPAGNEWINRYDVKGRLSESVDPDKGTTTYTYNDTDDLITATDARGEVLWYGYDALGRKTELRDDSASGPLRAVWKYDRLYTGQTVKGQLTETIRYEPAGSANAYKWQVRGFTTRYQPAGVNIIIPSVEGVGIAGTYVYSYGYSAYDGSPTTLTYPAGGGLASETVTTVYDPVTGLPTELETNAVGVGNYVAGRWYTPFGEPTLTTVKTAGGVYVEDAVYYDEATRRVTRTSIQPETATGTISDRTYSYDPAGNITAIADTPQIGPADTQCFRYDPLRRLTTAWTPNTGDCSGDPTVTNLGGPAPYWLDWTFDTVGNRLTETSHTTSGDTTRTYTMPTGGPGVARPHAVTQVTTTTPGQPPVTTTYAYDNTGNTICRPTGTAANTCPTGSGSQTLSWDAEGRLATVKTGSTTIETNIYTPDGTRLIRRDTTGTTLYLPGQELRREGSTTTATRYYTFAGQTCAMRTPTGLTWLYNDHQGTQQIAVNAATQQVTQRRQTPYGTPRGANPTWPNQKGFVGGDTDPTGLTLLGARHYDPQLGRFISIDPVMDLTDPQQWHGYVYANNTPITASDPTGLLSTYCGPDGILCGINAGYDACAGGCKPISKLNTVVQKAWEFKRGWDAGLRNWLPDKWAGIKALVNDPIGSLEGVVRQRAAWNMKYLGFPYPAVGGDIGTLCVMTGLCQIYEDFKAGNYYQAGYGSSQLTADVSASVAAAAATEGIGSIAGAVTRGLSSLLRVRPRFRPGCKNSFVPGTAVVMADGSTKPIEEVDIGDTVLATDPETGETKAKTVTATIIGHGSKNLAEITVDTDGAAGNASGVVTATDDHPFWVPNLNKWVDATDLQAGQWLQTSAGTWVQITAVRRWSQPATVYNLTVTDIHTYYVLAGDTPVLVHNCGVTSNRSEGTLANELAAAERLGISPLRAGTPGFQNAVSTGGEYLWAVTDDGVLTIVPKLDTINHTVATGGAPVRGAGEVTIRGGMVRRINNFTGHYWSECRCGADLEAGVDAFINAGVPVLRRGITQYGY